MLLPRLQPPLRAAIASISRVGPSTHPQASLNEAFAQLSVCRAGTRFGNVRHASHKAQGAVNKAKDGPGKRLGAKKSGGVSTSPQNAH
jgi:large subunit ribosomal protein L27